MDQRSPSTDTRFRTDVPLGLHVEKAKLPSATLRRIRRPRVRSGTSIIVFAGRDRQFEIGPATFGSFARRQVLPDLLVKALRDRGGGAGDRLLFTPGTEHMIGSSTQDMTFARRAQQGFQSLQCRTRCLPQRTRTAPLRDRASDHLKRGLLRRKAHIARDICCLQLSGFVRPFLWQVERSVDKGMAMPRP